MVPLARRSYGRENTTAKGKERKEGKSFGKWAQGLESLLIVEKVDKKLLVAIKVAKELKKWLRS
nr:MAG: hypothetical protein [Bacteriophage sp.]